MDLRLVDLVRGLNQVAYCWMKFGTFLCIDRKKLKEIEGRKTDEECLQDVIDLWWDHYCQDECPLQMIYEALEQVENKVLAKDLRDHFNS